MSGGSNGGPYIPQPNSNSAYGNLFTFGGAWDPRVLLTPALRGTLFVQLDLMKG